MIYPYQGKWPAIHPSVFLADNVTVVGDVVIEEDASIWFGTVIRGDVHPIRIGARTNVQDNSILHVTWEKYPLLIGADVTVGHGAILHGCTIGDGCLIGMGAKVLDAAVVEQGAFVAAGSLVKQGFVVPSGMLVGGVPARVLRALTAEEQAGILESVANYRYYVSEYRSHGDLARGLDAAAYFGRSIETRP
jgi:gamma-carbonic anhydrase